MLGGIDEISDYNYNIERLGGWYKTEIPANGLYESKTEGSIAGEGCAVFCLSKRPQNALFEIVDVNTMHSTDVDSVQSGIKQFCDKHALNLSETMLLSGHNGDVRNEALHQAVENVFDKSTVIRYKHFSVSFQPFQHLHFGSLVRLRQAMLFCRIISIYVRQKLKLKTILSGIITKAISMDLYYQNLANE